MAVRFSVVSDRSFDMLQAGKKQAGESRLAIASGHVIADTGFLVMAEHIDAVYKRMTVKQATAITGLLRGQTQQQVALNLSKSNSTISQLVSSGGWPAIERLLQQYEFLINRLYDDRIGVASHPLPEKLLKE